jgi:hypothetical protein
MRLKLSDKYSSQREEICNKILYILQLNEDKYFLLCDLDEDLDKQRLILDLKDDIKTFFACSTISTFKPNFECKRPYLNIIRSILRQQGFTVESKNHWNKISNGTFQRTMKFHIYREG